MHFKRSLPAKNFPPAGCRWLGRALALVRQQPRSPNPLHSDSSLPFSFVEKLPLFFGLDQQHQKPTLSTAPPTSSQPPPPVAQVGPRSRKGRKKSASFPDSRARTTDRTAGGAGKRDSACSERFGGLGQACGWRGRDGQGSTDGRRQTTKGRLGKARCFLAWPRPVDLTESASSHPILVAVRSSRVLACVCCGRLG